MNNTICKNHAVGRQTTSPTSENPYQNNNLKLNLNAQINRANNIIITQRPPHSRNPPILLLLLHLSMQFRHVWQNPLLLRAQLRRRHLSGRASTAARILINIVLKYSARAHATAVVNNRVLTTGNRSFNPALLAHLAQLSSLDLLIVLAAVLLVEKSEAVLLSQGLGAGLGGGLVEGGAEGEFGAFEGGELGFDLFLEIDVAEELGLVEALVELVAVDRFVFCGEGAGAAEFLGQLGFGPAAVHEGVDAAYLGGKLAASGDVDFLDEAGLHVAFILGFGDGRVGTGEEWPRANCFPVSGGDILRCDKGLAVFLLQSIRFALFKACRFVKSSPGETQQRY